MMWAFMDAALNNRRAMLLSLLIYYLVIQKLAPTLVQQALPALALSSSALVAYTLLGVKREGVLEHLLSASPKDNWRTLTELVLAYSIMAASMSGIMLRRFGLESAVEVALATLALSPSLMVLELLLPEALARIAPIALALVAFKLVESSLELLIIGTMLSIVLLISLKSKKLQELVIVGWEG